MPSIINSDNGAISGSAGFKFAAADDGILEIQNSGNTAISISPEGIATFAQPPLTAMPAFRVTFSNNLSITNNVETVVPYSQATFNTHPEWFNFSTHRFIPQIAGYYQIIYNESISGSTNTTSYYSLLVTQNGTVSQVRQIHTAGVVTLFRHVGSDLIYFNGTTDYVEHVVRISGNNGTLTAGDSVTYMCGFLVRPD
jgi:hypothetical protein